MPPAEAVGSLPEQLRMKQRLHLERRAKLGEVQFPNSAVVGPKRLVGVGNRVYFVDERTNPVEFMGRHLSQVLGHDWLRTQQVAAPSQRHPVADWYHAVEEWQKRTMPNADGSVRGATINGLALAWFLLAYDVWILSHYRLIDPLVERLRDAKQFQGARYEITAYAHFVRAGFSLKPEDERDNSARHVEFIAEHKQAGERVAVEAKSRHRPGVLGSPAAGFDLSMAPRPSIERLLRDALAKKPRIPYVIFVDLNLPPSISAEQSEDRMQAAVVEVANVICEYESGGEKLPATAVMLTNYAHHYGSIAEVFPAHDHVQVGIPMTTHPFRDPRMLDRIAGAMRSYGRLPEARAEFD